MNIKYNSNTVLLVLVTLIVIILFAIAVTNLGDNTTTEIVPNEQESILEQEITDQDRDTPPPVVQSPEQNHDVIIGMTRADANAYAEAESVPFRIGSIDGEMRGVTMDYRPGRITASLENGVVTTYTVE